MTTPHRPLGKAPAQPARPHLRLSPVLQAANLPTPPETCDWQDDHIVWPMYGNDSWGDCVWAEIGHGINQLTYYALSDEQQPTDDDILKGYSDVTGFNPDAGQPGSNATDNGTYVQDAMAYWRKTGVGGHKIVAYASIDPSNLDHVRLAIALFGSVSIGIQFPDSAMRQFDAGQPWDVVRGAKNEGGHCILGGAYDKDGIGLVTWGKETRMTWRFFTKYADEVWVPLDAEGLTKAGQYFTGVSTFYALGQRFADLTGETNPVPAPQPTPTPDPVPTPPPSPVPATDPRLAQATALVHEADALMQALANDPTTSGA